MCLGGLKLKAQLDDNLASVTWCPSLDWNQNTPAVPKPLRSAPPSDGAAENSVSAAESKPSAPRCRAAAYKGLICILLFCCHRGRPTRGALSWDGAGFCVSCVNCIFGCSKGRAAPPLGPQLIPLICLWPCLLCVS